MNRTGNKSVGKTADAPTPPPPPPQWAQAVVAPSLHCRGCGYDLRGLSASGRCPECGMEIWMTVSTTVDPTASRLPQIRNPPAVGNSILGMTICMLVGMLLLLSPSVDRMVELWDRTGAISWADQLPSLTWTYAGMLAVLGGWAVWTLAPPRGSEPKGAVWIDIWRIDIGYIGWLACAALWTQFDGPGIHEEQRRLVFHLGAAVFATIGLIGLRGVFRIIGQRSREYRRSQGGRQSLDLIILTIAAGFVGALAQCASRQSWFPGQWRDGTHTMGMVLLWISNFMLLIGLSYLVANAWWVRSALRRPPPPLDQVLSPDLNVGGVGGAGVGGVGVGGVGGWVQDREE